MFFAMIRTEEERVRVEAVALDLDDTLLRNDRSISSYTLSTLRRAADAGIRVIPASGRTRDSMFSYVQQIGCADFFIACNGAEVWSKDKQPLMRELLSVDLAREAAAFAEARGCYVQTYAEDCFFFNQQGEWAEAYARSSDLRGVYVGPLTAYLCQPTPKLLVIAAPDRIAKLLEEAKKIFGERVALTTSKPHFLEINPSHVTKGNALRWCAKHFGFSLEGTVAFGDSLNDLPMLTAVGRGICVANAYPTVLSAGLPVCPSNEEDGPASYIDQVVLTAVTQRGGIL